MPVLFVHGVPATSRLWKRVIEIVDREDEVLAVDLPGIAAPAPEGWVAHKDNYVAWVIERIEELHARGGPVHLVGHDWGCLMSLRAASLRPELLRSVAAGNAPIDEHWPLHAMWRLWAMPGIGERMMEEILAPAMATGSMTSMGFPPEDALHTAFATAEGRRAVLDLYRSAPGVGREWAPDLARIVVPSMLIWGVRDMIVPVEIGRRMAHRIGSELVELDSDHFWPYEQPEAAAAALKRLWARAESKTETILTQDISGFLAMLK